MTATQIRSFRLAKAACALSCFLTAASDAFCQAHSDENKDWSVASSRWSIPLGFSSGPVVVSEKNILVGTGEYDPTQQIDSGLMLCLSHEGTILWKAVHPRLEKRVNDIPGMGINTRPVISGNRVYYFNNRGEVVCADLDGFRDSINDGPFTKETRTLRDDADFVWILDLVAELGIFKRDASDIGNPLPSVILENGVLYCVTGQGSRVGNVPHGVKLFDNPAAPSLVAIHAETGKVLWTNAAPGENIMYGQWGTPTIFDGNDGGRTIVFPGGDGYLHSVQASSGEIIWSRDLNDAKATKWESGRGTRGFCSATPLVWNDLIIAGIGQDLETMPGLRFPVTAISTNGMVSWSFQSDRLDSCLGSVAAKGDVLFILATNGNLFAVDARTGKELEMKALGERAAMFSSPVVFGDFLFVATDLHVHVFSADIKLEKVNHIELLPLIISSPTIFRDTMYVTTSESLIALPLPVETTGNR